jgi:hypothetical protein
MDNESKQYVKYLYCFKVGSEYTWYKISNGVLASSGGTIKKSMYYRVSPNDVTENFPMTSDINMLSSSNDFTLDVTPGFNDGCTEFVINIGLQYNKINNTKNPILGFDVSSSKDSIVLYQNQIVLGFPYYTAASATKEIFIPKCDDFDSGKSENYHLITIAYTKANEDTNSNTIRYQCCVYIDGILETAFKSFGTGSQPLAGVHFYKGHYSVNLLDITYFNSNKTAVNDVDINYYYNTYISTKDNIEIDSVTTAILNNFYDTNIGGGSTYSIENNLLKVQGTLIDNIAESVSIPTLVFKRDRLMSDYGNLPVLEWMNAIYDQDSQGASTYKVPVEVK